MPTPASKKWYLLQCKPGQTQRALENLQRQQYDCYLPLHSVERIRRGKRQTLSEPLFPGYLFIHLDSIQDNWMPIRSTRGVQRLVAFGKQLPTTLPDALIEGIRDRCEAIPHQPLIEPGSRVRICEGSFKDMEAIFLSQDGDERVILLLTLLQREARITLPLTQVTLSH